MKNKDFLYVLPKEDYYYFKDIDRKKANIAFTYLNRNKFWRLLQNIQCCFLRHFNFLCLDFFNKIICKKNYGKELIDNVLHKQQLVILDSFVREDLLFLIKKRNKKKTMFLKIWNSIDDDCAKLYSKYFPKSNIYTYSKYEAEKYGFQYQNDTYLTDMTPKELPLKYDLYFLGTDKNRVDTINEIGGYLARNKYTVKLEILGSNNNKYKYISYINDYKKFDDYLDEIFSSKCLLDVTTHRNITFRTIESFVFKKKIISNNRDLLNYDFFNPNNIFIIDVELLNDKTLDELLEFLKKPYIDVPKEIINKYDFYTSYNEFENLVKINKERGL